MGVRTSFLGARGNTALFLPFTGDADDNLLVGSAGDDTIDGLGGDDILQGGGGDDVLDGGDGLDTADYTTAASGVVVRLFAGLATVDGDGGVDTLISIENITGSAFNDTLLGSAGDNVLRGGAGRDYLIGLGGNDILYGGSGAPNQLQGGTGDDDYHVDANDTLVEFAGEGHDRVFTTQARLVLPANLEDLTFIGGGAFTGVGNGEDNSITGGAGADILSGGGGDDRLDGGGGVDTADYRQASIGVYASLEDGAADDDGDGGTDTFDSIENLYGSDFDDVLLGDGRDNVLEGGAGDDILRGYEGDDTLRGGDGYDLIDYSGAPSGAAVNLNSGRATDGEGGVDTLVAIEDVDGSAHDDILIGNAEENYLYGNDGSDYLLGLDGDDLLEGGSGAPNQLQGGLGDDRYYVEANDTLIELEDEGFDSVMTTLNRFTLRANFEELIFDGDGDFVGTGNALDNVIYGGDGDDILTGGGGDDVLVGSSGCGCGGPGFDTVVLAGVFADYTIEDLGGGTWSVTDTVADRDGVDLLVDIAQLRFSDGAVFALVAADGAPAPAAGKGMDDAQVLPGVGGRDAFFDRDADLPHILPGLSDDEFILGKDADPPLILPGDDGAFEGLLNVDADIGAGFPTHMLTLHPEGGLMGGADDAVRLHDHDDWLF